MSLLKTNLEYLEKIFPRFREEILPFYAADETVEVIQTRENVPTCSWKGKLLHSRHAPIKEASRTALQTMSDNPDCIIIEGFGLGYHAEAFLQYSEDIPICIIEPSIPFFLRALELRDFSDVFSCERIKLLIGIEPDAVVQVLSQLNTHAYTKILIRGSIDASPEYFQRLHQVLDEYKGRQEINTNTLIRFGKLWVKNLFKNLEVLSRSGRITAFEKVFSGIPSFILAAGPSLDDLFPYAREIRERGIIIAVDTSLNFCRRAGIEPDFIVVVDPQYWNTKYLEGHSFPGSILISESSTYPSVFRMTGADPFFCSSLFPLGQFIERYIGISGTLGAGGSVATTAWDFARFAGSTSIYNAGLDLSFPRRQTHYTGSFFEETSHYGASRILPAETASFRYLFSADPYLHDNNSGGKTLTDKRLLLYRWWFENQAQQHGEIRNYLLSGLGIPIEGFTPVRARTLINELPPVRGEINKRRNEAAATGYPSDDRTRSAVISACEALALELETVKQASETGIEITEKLLQEEPGSPEMQAGLDRLDSLDRMIRNSGSKDITGFLMQQVVKELLGDKHNDSVPLGGLTNSLRLYHELADSAVYHLELLDQAVSRLSG